MPTHENEAYQEINQGIFCKKTKRYNTLKEQVLPVTLWLDLDKWSRISSSLDAAT